MAASLQAGILVTIMAGLTRTFLQGIRIHVSYIYIMRCTSGAHARPAPGTVVNIEPCRVCYEPCNVNLLDVASGIGNVGDFAGGFQPGIVVIRDLLEVLEDADLQDGLAASHIGGGRVGREWRRRAGGGFGGVDAGRGRGRIKGR